jgi:DNA-binding IclR family transcriptional regulator
MPDSTVKSADRVLTLLERLGEASSEMSHADLAEALAIPKSSLSQLLKTLTARQWLAYGARTKTYALGPAVAALADRAGRRASLTEKAAPILGRLAFATAETCALNLLKGDETEVAATVLSPQRLLSVMRQGDRAPLYATSGGKAILAFLPQDALEDYLGRLRPEAITERTLLSVEALRADLAEVKRCGFAISREEFTPGVIGLACPLADRDGSVSAAVNVAAPASRYSDSARDPIIETIRRAVAEFRV